MTANDWSELPLSSLLAEPLANGRSVPDGTGFPVLRLGALRDARTDFNERKQGSWTEAEARPFLVRKGDLLVSRGNGSVRLVGRASLVAAEPPPVAFPDTMIRVRVRADILDQRFLALQWNAPRTRKHIERTARTTAGIYKISQGDLLALRLVVPPLPVQFAIVEAVETELSRLDAAVASLNRAKANLARARASVLKAAVEGRLVPTEAELAREEGRPYEQASAILGRTAVPPRPNRYKTRSTDVIPGHSALSVGDTGHALPEGWARAAMVDVARMESGHTPSRSHPEWWDGDVPWIGIADARNHHGGIIHRTEQNTNEDGLANSAARLLPAGTVCVSRTASVGYVTVMGRPMATSQDFVAWICTPAVDPHWARVVFLADREALQRFGKGSVHKTIYFPELLSMYIALPPLAEQHRIVAEVDRRLSVLDTLEATVDANLARCARLRQSILQRAFEGRLVPAVANG